MESTQAIETLYDFISNLRQRNLQLHSDNNKPIPHGQSLAYADALLRHRYVRSALEVLPPQIVVIGPTQAGKGTIVNLLLGTEMAQASPLAGFTRHVQGFTSAEVNDTLSAEVQRLLPEWKSVRPEQLNNEKLGTFSLVHTEANNLNPGENFIIWDTPDFDSVSSRDYRATVPVMCAMADAIVLVVSKEKYADQSVWGLLKLIAAIQRPLFVLINKTAKENMQTLKQAMQEKLDKAGIHSQTILCLPYQHGPVTPATLTTPEDIQTLRNQIQQVLNQPAHTTPVATLKNWLGDYWDEWLTPAKSEINSRNAWTKLLNDQQTEAIEQFDRDYLQQPHYSETLQKAIIRLLELLEVPSVANGLQTMRQIITWPARKIGSLIKDQTRFRHDKKKEDRETTILKEVCLHYQINLQNQIVRRADDQWWKNMDSEFQNQQSGLEGLIESAIRKHKQAFEPEIELAANQLLDYLKKHPVALNSLRTARVTADAAAVLLALKTGGIALHDLALAPAFVAISSFMAEGAVGQHMQSVEEELKKKQLISVQENIFENSLRQTLVKLSDNMSKDGLYNFTKAEVENADSALEKLNG